MILFCSLYISGQINNHYITTAEQLSLYEHVEATLALAWIPFLILLGICGSGEGISLQSHPPDVQHH